MELLIFLALVYVWRFGFVPRREAGDVWCLPTVWNLRAVIWFHFAISSLVLLPSPVTLSVYLFLPAGPFFWTFFQKSVQYFSLRDRLFLYGFCLAVRISAACCHMALVFAVMHLCNILHFLLLLSIPFLLYFKKNLVFINRRNGPRYQRVLALCAFLTGAIRKGLILRKFCVWSFVFVLLYVKCQDWFCGLMTCVRSK